MDLVRSIGQLTNLQGIRPYSSSLSGIYPELPPYSISSNLV